MAQIRKMDCQVLIKSSADKFYDAFRTKARYLPKMSNGLIAYVKLVQGDWNSVGTVRLWSYASEGKSQMVKEMFEEVDEENKRMVFKLVEGDLLHYYGSWRNILNITSTAEGSLVKWTMEFEKRNEDIPDPVEYAASMVALTKNIDAYLLNA
ncbi:MLP-like protein 28 [Hibiscus trionum]|uniref:MLP-like protein 28 n=1 Tax=Hibiscus trionum TaxID=183268 RepID=A0A9W7IXN0_HIBTR|nr:MLP-like protein 28 [Hibiscus trionum]